MAKEDGGSAFPGGDGQYGGGPHHQTGMSLRDYFAGQALACLAQHFNDGHEADRVASEAYMLADAMLAARK